ncbi:MAG TPA: hypothetical protein VIZ22_06105 [Candidatus Limnocylindrales bacterium]
MEVIRFARALVPLAAITLMSTPGAMRPAVSGTADPPWDPPACLVAVGVPPAAAGTAWYRTDATLDASGTLAGQQLTVGVVGGGERRVALPAESFASGPVRGLVTVGDDDGTRSRLRVVDPAHGCAWTIAVEATVIRSAILAPDAGSTWEHRVDRATRADLGVWRRPVSGGIASRVAPGLAPDVAHGRTFATDLRWAPDGRRVIASCGELACRTRLVDPATGLTEMTSRTGPVIGVAGTRVIAYGVCPGLPCPVRATEPSTGAVETLVDEAGPAALAVGALVYERDGHLVSQDLRTRVVSDVAASDGLAPLPGGSGATAGMDLPAGSVTLAAAGQRPAPSTARRFDPFTSAIGPIEAVQR